jgi:hypothetical protein
MLTDLFAIQMVKLRDNAAALEELNELSLKETTR